MSISFQEDKQFGPSRSKITEAYIAIRAGSLAQQVARQLVDKVIGLKGLASPKIKACPLPQVQRFERIEGAGRVWSLRHPVAAARVLENTHFIEGRSHVIKYRIS